MVNGTNELNIKIKVFGLGGGGGNAVDNMIRNNVQGVDFAIANTDKQAMSRSSCKEQILLGSKTTKGLGAGADPEVGRKACVESEQEIIDSIKGYDMVFLAAGMGGGTGTAACSCFAKIAKSLGILSVAIVTKPFTFEGKRRCQLADSGLEELKENADATVVVSNNNLKALIGRKPLNQAFEVADNTLRCGVTSITNLVNSKALINLDFADVCTTLRGQGDAILGIGTPKKDSEHPAIDAAKAAVTPMLLENSIKGAKQAIVNITGGPSISLMDAEDAIQVIQASTGNELDIIFGVDIDEELNDDNVVVTVIATGFDKVEKNEIHLKKEETTFTRKFRIQQKAAEMAAQTKAQNTSSTKEVDIMNIASFTPEETYTPKRPIYEEEITVDDVVDVEEDDYSFFGSLKNRFEKEPEKDYSYNTKSSFFANRK